MTTDLKAQGMKLLLFMILALVLFVNAPVTFAQTRPADRYDACVERLAAGQNSQRVRLNRQALREALRGLRRFQRNLADPYSVLLVDYSRRSTAKRADLIDFRRCDVVVHEYAIHGGAIYQPYEQNWGEPNRNGMLQYCVRPDRSRQYMTRPGFYVTAGCHMTAKQNWTQVYGQCQGVKLAGLEQRTAEAMSAGIVLHEHLRIPNDGSIKPVGQGCPGFAPGRLANMFAYGLKVQGTLVYVYAPQCR